MEQQWTRLSCFEQRARTDVEARHRLLQAVIARVTAENAQQCMLTGGRVFREFVLPEDVPFLLELVQQEKDEQRQAVLSHIILTAWGAARTDVEQLKSSEAAIRTLWQASRDGSGPKLPAFEAEFNRHFAPELAEERERFVAKLRGSQTTSETQESESETHADRKPPSILIAEALDAWAHGELPTGRTWHRVVYC
ncbi:MAG: hypothetical protein M3347_00920, partial [Armatimonadota bacterium]|nr:hypothetical protein [Armatimonadota bacterium]